MQPLEKNGQTDPAYLLGKTEYFKRDQPNYTPPPEKGSTLYERYINFITADLFGEMMITAARQKEEAGTEDTGNVTTPGWYWADRMDNRNFNDWHGPYETEEEALGAGREYRRAELDIAAGNLPGEWSSKEHELQGGADGNG